MSTRPDPWQQALRAAALFAVDPRGLAGVVLRALPGPVRDRWLETLEELLPAGTALRRLPAHAGDERLLGGLDLAATLRHGRLVAERGLLEEADGGVLLCAMAERMTASTAARLASALDTGAVLLERDGLTRRIETRFAVLALDEGMDEDEHPPAALRDRLALEVDLSPIRPLAARDGIAASQVAAARERLPDVRVDEAATELLCGTAQALGIASLRAPLLALAVARASAALDGRRRVEEPDLAEAARWVLAARARALPEPQAAEPADPPPPEASEPASAEPPERDEAKASEPPEAPERPAPEAAEASASDPEERILEAVQAALPAGQLETLRLAASRSGPSSPGRSGARRDAGLRGRPSGVRRGDPCGGARLALVETLRAAAPWQPLRRSETGSTRVEVRRDDFRVQRYRRRQETTVIFAVDASGSSALHRMGEAKGAVERLLGDCYARRDRVALIAFRGEDAELLLPPTRSLLRARRGLAGLPGGGGTPLAAGLETSAELARAVLRRGGTPLLVLLTDGRANVARDGGAGRERAREDALVAARRLRAEGVGSLLVDTSPRPQPTARELALALGARYLPLPRADSQALFDTVRAAASAAAPERAAQGG